jgi:hypothetical protein
LLKYKMGVIEDIKNMKGQGKSEGEIREELRKAGVNEREINEGFSRAQIKDAVASGDNNREVGILPPISDSGQQQEEYGGETSGSLASSQKSNDYSYQPSQEQRGAESYSGMQPSMVTEGPSAQQGVGGGYSAQGSEGALPQEYSSGYSGVDAYSGYPAYQPYQEAMSSDMITEISDQVVSERLSYLQDKMEKALNFRTVAEAKISVLDERLKRIEKVLDKLQLAILQKVGEYVTDVGDIKKEMEESRKSFNALRGRGGGKIHKRRKHSKK